MPLRAHPDSADIAVPDLPTAIGRGIRDLCPVCGQARLLTGFLTVIDTCPVCGTALGAVRADDAPPYITIFLVGHLVVPPLVWLSITRDPPIWLMAAIFLPLTLLLTLALLRPVKGATVGLMLRLGLYKSE